MIRPSGTMENERGISTALSWRILFWTLNPARCAGLISNAPSEQFDSPSYFFRTNLFNGSKVEIMSLFQNPVGAEAQTPLVAEKMETPYPERCSPDWLKGASSNVGQASRLSPSKNSPHLLVIAGQATKPRLKAIIQSQRQARRLSYGMDSAYVGCHSFDRGSEE